MKADITRDIQNCTYSIRTEDSARFDAIVSLGKKLVNELELEGSADTLGRWMSHYVSELIYEAENANPENKEEKRRICAEAIIKLWRNRRILRNGSRPFESLEPVLEILEKLNPDSDTPRYFRVVRDSASDEDHNSQTQSWFDLIDGLDSTATMLVRYCLTKAIESSSGELKEWVSLAENAGLDSEEDVQIIRIILSEKELVDEKNPEEIEKEKIKKRLKKLEVFLELANVLASDLRARC